MKNKNNLIVGAVALACVLLIAMLSCRASNTGTQGSTSTPAPAEESAETTESAPKAEESTTAEADKENAAKKDSDAKASKGNPELAARLNADFETVANGSGMSVCVSFIDLTDGTRAGYQADEVMPSASMIKLIIAHTFLEQVEAGKFNLDDNYTLKASDFVGGTGVISGYGAGTKITYRDILMRMIDASDNTATNILIDAMGMDIVNADAAKLGLKNTQLNRRMMDYDAIAAGIENYTTANDLAVLLRMVYEKSFVSADASALMLQALEQQQDWGGILSGLPEGTTFAHKTGTLETVRHDGGIIEGNHPIVLVVLCGGSGYWEGGALSTMSDVASVVVSDCGL